MILEILHWHPGAISESGSLAWTTTRTGRRHMTDIPSPHRHPLAPLQRSRHMVPRPRLKRPLPSRKRSQRFRRRSALPPASAVASPRLATVNAINWPNAFDFVHVFRGFRLAINPAKLGLALLAILLIYSAGRLFDFAWGPQATPARSPIIPPEPVRNSPPSGVEVWNTGRIFSRGRGIRRQAHLRSGESAQGSPAAPTTFSRAPRAEIP